MILTPVLAINKAIRQNSSSWTVNSTDMMGTDMVVHQAGALNISWIYGAPSRCTMAVDDEGHQTGAPGEIVGQTEVGGRARKCVGEFRDGMK
jgi:hypothetical protein